MKTTQLIEEKSTSPEIDEHHDEHHSTSSDSNLNKSNDDLSALNLKERLGFTNQDFSERKFSAPNPENIRLSINVISQFAKPGNKLRNSYICKLLSKGLLC